MSDENGIISPPEPNLLLFVREHVRPDDIVLDVGSGPGRYRNIKCKQYFSLDGWKKNKPDYLVNLAEEDMPFEDNSFDVLMMLDFVEHLEKERSKEILRQCQKVTRRDILLLTPKQWSDNKAVARNPVMWDYGNELCDHKSIWDASDFPIEDGWVSHPIDALYRYHLYIWTKKEQANVASSKDTKKNISILGKKSKAIVSKISDGTEL